MNSSHSTEKEPYWVPKGGGTHGNQRVTEERRRGEVKAAIKTFEAWVTGLLAQQKDGTRNAEGEEQDDEESQEAVTEAEVQSVVAGESPDGGGTGTPRGEATIRRAMETLKYDDHTRKEVESMLGSSRAIYHRAKFEREFDHDGLLQGLPSAEQEVYRNNPHIRQVFANGYAFHQCDRKLKASDRLLTPDKGRTPYRSRNMEAKTVEHWGQRKLLLSEVEFLTLYGRAGDTVVYAGAAPGTHINFLAAAMFPSMKFVLVDPARFDAFETESVQIVNECFTDEMARGYEGRGHELLFICDIRSMDSTMGEEEKEERVLVDMESQKRWIEVMRPRASMLKFRLPYDVKKYPAITYLRGDIFLPIWGPRTTTECRLVVTDWESTVEYDVADYEKAMFHFNTVTRVTHFEHDQHAEGYDHCYDCTAEAFVLKQYLMKVHGLRKKSRIREAIGQLAKVLSENAGSSRKSLKIDIDSDSDRRRKGAAGEGSGRKRRRRSRSRSQERQGGGRSHKGIRERDGGGRTGERRHSGDADR